MLHWRTFSVFGSTQVQAYVSPDEQVDNKKNNQLPPLGPNFTPKYSVECTAPGKTSMDMSSHVLAIANEHGAMKIVRPDFAYVDVEAHKISTVGMAFNSQRNMLITMGLEDTEGTMRLKFWNIDACRLGSTSNKGAILVYAMNVFNAKFPPIAVTSFSVLNDLTQCSVGLANGALILIDGDLTRDVQREYILLKKKGPLVVHVHFHPITTDVVSLYVVTVFGVFTYYTRGMRRRQAPLNLDTFPANTEVLDAALTPTGRLLVATPSAVYFYEREENRECFVDDSLKKQMKWVNGYLVLIQEMKTSPEHNTVTIYDLKNKFIAYTLKTALITELAVGWGHLFICMENQVMRLTEKDLTAKMAMFLRKHLYSIAINVAKGYNCDKDKILDIYQVYGDHLYEKGDYDNAMIQYLHTINYLEPSYVIRKFLDAQQIHNLTRYLEAMHAEGRANTDHTTLLLNCFTKLKDVDKLGQFISNKALKFDVKTAIKVCREAGYCEQALYLAKQHEEHEAYISVQLEELLNYENTLAYIWSLSFDHAHHFAKEYGQVLLDHLPAATTELFMFLCTQFVSRPLADHDSVTEDGLETKGQGGGEGEATSSLPDSFNESKEGKAAPEDFIHFFVGQEQYLEQFLESITSEPHLSPVIMNTLLELFLRQDGKSTALDEEQQQPANPAASSSNLSSNTAPALSMATSSTATSPAAASASSRNNEGKKQSHPNAHKIMNLLKNGKYDLDHALVLTKMYKFEKGTLYLYGKLKLYQEIVQHHMERDKYTDVIRNCKKYGDQDPQLWRLALVYFAAKKTPCESELIEILSQIDRHNILPPLLVLQMLAANPHKPLSVVRDYMIRTLHQEQSTIIADSREIRRLQEETEQMRDEITRLRTKATIFQGIRCQHCPDPLSLPAVHFLCMHSFHQRCIDNEQECPECAPEFKKVKDIKLSLKKSATEHDTFFKQLEESNDGFSTVAEYFGRGIFDVNEEPEEILMQLNDSKQHLRDDSPVQQRSSGGSGGNPFGDVDRVSNGGSGGNPFGNSNNNNTGGNPFGVPTNRSSGNGGNPFGDEPSAKSSGNPFGVSSTQERKGGNPFGNSGNPF